MPEAPTIAQTFRNAGCQAYAVGKLHVYPQRNRIGFDDVILGEEGRPQQGVVDDYELFLGDCGYAGQQFAHGMCNNEYLNRPWHLPEACHVTNWTTQQMARLIKRRDPTRPAFWYLSYCHPHPPLAPLACYLDMYRDIPPDRPYIGEWAKSFEQLPYALKTRRGRFGNMTPYQIESARRAFYALCTHIDHQLRVVVGTLREEGLLDNTIILFTSDHGDLLGNHGLWAKSLFYEYSAQVPMILVGVAGDERVGHHRVDNRLVGWQDVMPTLLHLAGVDIPETVEGRSMVDGEKRCWLHGECGNGSSATKMIHNSRFKLIYYPVGNRIQLFDLDEDPQELNDLSQSPAHRRIRDHLTEILIGELYAEDKAWAQDGALVGLPDIAYKPTPNRGLSGQRGSHWPIPPSAGRV
jgi:arylsulfatase A-like enzyme